MSQRCFSNILIPSPDPRKPIPSLNGGYRAMARFPQGTEGSPLGNGQFLPVAPASNASVVARAGPGSAATGPLPLTVREQLKLKLKEGKDRCFCPNPIGIFKTEAGIPVAYAPCKRWDCPHCGDVKKSQVLDRAKWGFHDAGGFRVRFLTLTLEGQAHEWDMGKYWNRLRASLRKCGFKFYRYFWVKERGVISGHIHMHVLIDAYVPQKLIKKYWYLATDKTSYIVDIRAPRHKKMENVAAYMMKYMTKALHVPLGKKQRRFGFSRHKGFKPIKFQSHTKLRFESMSIFDRELKLMADANCRLRDEKRRLRHLAQCLAKAPPGYFGDGGPGSP